jgi:predicted AAA+ superfamily ATPase
MQRAIIASLIDWSQQKSPLPLLIRGARQVGKTYAVEQFGSLRFENTITINFEFQPEFKQCFNTLSPLNIIRGVELLTNQIITPGKTLLFFDEIQECPSAIVALRYFKEQMPKLHVIGAGSLLEFTLNDSALRIPVGRIQYIYLKPLSFYEFLYQANQQLYQYLAEVNLSTTIPDPIHQQLLRFVREYMILGGMPAVLKTYFEQQNLVQCQHLQTALLNTYRSDFSKYATRTNYKYLQRLFDRAPAFIGQHIKYAKIDAEMRARELSAAFDSLKQAGLIYPIYSTTAAGLPLESLINEKRFKLLFLDIGLVRRASHINIELLFQEDILQVNQGALAEQFVGQELLAYQDPYTEGKLYFWSRDKKSSTAEVDYISHFNGGIFPIEVKAGNKNQLKSLRLYLTERQAKFGIRISQAPLALEDNILSIPLYLISQLERLVKELQ